MEDRRERLLTLQSQLEDTDVLINEARDVINEGNAPSDELHGLAGHDDSMEETLSRLLREKELIIERMASIEEEGPLA